ncbi:LPXTG-motif cell wall anchor domain protein [Ligilactobacillus ruminis]|nr:LPXTG-motif cell wall anchor domain protein [Ligilactobacillus ruminis]
MQNHHPNFLIINYGNYIKSESSIQAYLPIKYSAFDLTFNMIKSAKTVRAD